MKVLGLFSGIGGFELGLERAGLEIAAMCEIDPDCRSVLRGHWPDVPIHEDVRKFDAEQYEGIDIVCGGFPCQDVSDAARGRNRGLDGDRSGLWHSMACVVERTTPRFCLVENVDGAAWRRWVPTVRRDLHRLGYSSVSVRMRALDVGAPFIGSRIIVAATNSKGQPARAFHAQMAQLPKPAKRSRHWRCASGVGMGLDDGVPGGLAMYGNAVVPQQAEVIGQRIQMVGQA